MLKLWFTLLFCWRKSSPLTFQALNHCDSFYPPGCRLQCLCVKIPETWPQPVLYLYFSFTPAEGGRVLCYASAAAAASYIDIDESLMKTQCHRNHMIILFEYMLNELHRFHSARRRGDESRENVSTLRVRHPSALTIQTRAARTLKAEPLALPLSADNGFTSTLIAPLSVATRFYQEKKQRCRVGQSHRGLHCAGRPRTCTFNAPTHLFAQRRQIAIWSGLNIQIMID